MKRVSIFFLVAYLLAQIFQQYVFLTLPTPSNPVEEVARATTFLDQTRSLLILSSFFGLIVSFTFICCQKLKSAPELATIALIFLILFCFLEISYRSIELFTVNRTWASQFINATDEFEKSRLLDKITTFNTIVRAVYFPLLLSQMVGSLFLLATTFAGAQGDKYLRASMAVNSLRLAARLGGGYLGVSWLEPFNNRLYFPSMSLVFALLIIYCFKSESPLYKEAT
jgi:hypothetical protein